MVGFARTHMRCDLGSYAHPALTINSPPSKQGFKYESKWTVQSPSTSALWALGDWSCAPGECLVALRRGLEGRCAPSGPTAAAGPAPRPWLSCLAKHSEELERRVEELENSIEEAAKRIGAHR